MENKLRLILEDLEVDGDKIDEFLKIYEENVASGVQNIPVSDKSTTFLVKKMIDDEPDWRKKAQLAARLISLEL